MRRILILRLLIFTCLLLALDYLLLKVFSLSTADWRWLMPVLWIIGSAAMLCTFFLVLWQKAWASSLSGLLLIFALQLVMLNLLSGAFGEGYGPAAVVFLSLPVFLLLFAFAASERGRAALPRLNRSLRFVLPVVGVALLDYVLITYFNTLVWRYLWPYPALLVLIFGFVVLIWFPEFGRSIWMLRIVSALLLFIGQSYLIHSFHIMLEAPSILATLHFIGFCGMFLAMALNTLNQTKPKDHKTAPPLPDELPYVAAVVPTYGEPYAVLEKTVASIKKLEYPPERLFIVIADDGHRSEVEMMARIYGVDYMPGPRHDAKAGNLNAALQYLEQHFPQATLLLTQDADEVIHRTFLEKTVGYFSDPSIAFVQTPKEVLAPKNDPFGTRDRMFYDVLQVGRNGYNAAFACGSGVLWCIDAVKSIGGFATWNVVEDLTTSYQLHSAGYHSEYHNEILSVGLAPDDIPGLLKQRGTWAVDTWRLFLFDNPLFKRGLSFAQRLQYTELGLFYLTATFFTPLLMFVPLLSLATGAFVPIEGWALYPWLAISILYYTVLAHGQGMAMLRMWQYWIGHWPTYTIAFLIAVRSRRKKPKYVVTRKTRDNGFYGHLLWAQFLYLFAGAAVILRELFIAAGATLVTHLTNITILLFFMVMMSRICSAAFYGMGRPALRSPIVLRDTPQQAKQRDAIKR